MKFKTCILLLFLLSCESIFHEESNEYLILDNVEEITEMLTGAYAKISEVYDPMYFYALIRADDINIFGTLEYHSDDGNEMGCSIGQGYSPDMVEVIGNIYLNFYSAIKNLNSIILQVDSTKYPAQLGESYFLRAYCYFQLARLFGQPPLITDIDVDFFSEKPSYEEVYNFIVNDLENAIHYLPADYAAARIPGESPHQGTAKALLAEVYLAMAGFPVNDAGKYALSAQMALEVMQDADNYHFALQDDFGSLWTTQNRHNSECLFGLYYSDDNPNMLDYLTEIDLWTGPDDYQVRSFFVPEYSYYKKFPQNYRKYKSFITGFYSENYFPSDTEQDLYSLKYTLIDPEEQPCEYLLYVSTLKYIDFDAMNRTDHFHWNVGNNLTTYLLRYAQTLLTYAEAKARSGNLDASCFEAVNQVRRRANQQNLYTLSEFDLPENLNTEQFLDSVVWERAFELSMEPQGRWFDIIRLNLRKELEAARLPTDQVFTVPDKYLTEDWYFYKIPQHDRWLNPNYTDEAD